MQHYGPTTSQATDYAPHMSSFALTYGRYACDSSAPQATYGPAGAFAATTSNLRHPQVAPVFPGERHKPLESSYVLTPAASLRAAMPIHYVQPVDFSPSPTPIPPIASASPSSDIYAQVNVHGIDPRAFSTTTDACNSDGEPEVDHDEIASNSGSGRPSDAGSTYMTDEASDDAKSNTDDDSDYEEGLEQVACGSKRRRSVRVAGPGQIKCEELDPDFSSAGSSKRPRYSKPTVPVPVPHLTKKSRGRRVPTAPVFVTEVRIHYRRKITCVNSLRTERCDTERKGIHLSGCRM
jgi:hypothetical protein